MWQELPPSCAQIPFTRYVGPALASGTSAANSHNLQWVALGHWCLPTGMESWKCLEVLSPFLSPPPPRAPVVSDWCGIKTAFHSLEAGQTLWCKLFPRTSAGWGWDLEFAPSPGFLQFAVPLAPITEDRPSSLLSTPVSFSSHFSLPKPQCLYLRHGDTKSITSEDFVTV